MSTIHSANSSTPRPVPVARPVPLLLFPPTTTTQSWCHSFFRASTLLVRDHVGSKTMDEPVLACRQLDGCLGAVRGIERGP